MVTCDKSDIPNKYFTFFTSISNTLQDFIQKFLLDGEEGGDVDVSKRHIHALVLVNCLDIFKDKKHQLDSTTNMLYFVCYCVVQYTLL